MTDVIDPTTAGVPTFPPLGICPPLWTSGWPGAHVLFAWAGQERDVLAALPVEAHEPLLQQRLNALKERGLLSEEEVRSLVGRMAGVETADAPPMFAPDGSPSLSGILAGTLTPSKLESFGFFDALVTAAGALLGEALGGPLGAIIGGAIAHELLT